MTGTDRHEHSSTAFPFSAIVGMDGLGLALCLAAVGEHIGGVLVRGEKGTAKTTMVRGLAGSLGDIAVVPGCRFACDPGSPDPRCPDAERHGEGASRRPVPLVELPVGASEDRVAGSLHLDSLLSSGRVSFEPGLLAAANRGVLYVDEVNLLPDHLVDGLLDAAATGRARVEREGVSVEHAARFVLVGTMNPEEGDLRPQLLDRFGLVADVAASRDPATRVEVISRRLDYERDPAGFVARFAAAERELAGRISAARAAVGAVEASRESWGKIARICAAFDVDGMRGDLVTARTAAAHAAWAGRSAVIDEDIRVAARLALPHRRRRNPFDTPQSAAAELEEILRQVLGDEPPPEPDDEPTPPDAPEPDDGSDSTGPSDPSPSNETPGAPDSAEPQANSGPESQSPPPRSAGDEQTEAPTPPEAPPARRAPDQGAQRASDPFATQLLRLDRVGQGVAGRRSRAVTTVGRHVRAVEPGDPRGRGVAVTDTIRAAVPAQHDRGRGAGEALRLKGIDLRRSLRDGKEGNLVVFCVDASGSMGARKRMTQVKTAVLSLLVDAYQRRDKVAVVTFARDHGQILLPATASVELARARLDAAATGGRTPLAEGLTVAGDLVRRERAKDPMRRPLLVVLTDGRATHGPDAIPRSRAAAARIAGMGVTSVVLDCESPRGVRLHLARDLAAVLGARLLPLADIDLAATARPAPRAPGAA